MGIADGPIQNLIRKVRSWLSWGWGDQNSGISREYWMPDVSCQMCYECDIRFTVFNRRHHCRSCGRVFCFKCMQDTAEGESKFCKFCFQAVGIEMESKTEEYDEKLNLVMTPRQKFDFGGEGLDKGSQLFENGRLERFLQLQHESSSPHAANSSCATSSIDPFSPLSIHHSGSRSDEEDIRDTGKHFLSPLREYDIDSSSINNLNEFYSLQSVASSPADSPSKMNSSPNRVDYSVQLHKGIKCSVHNDQLHIQQSVGDSIRPETNADSPEMNVDYSDDLSILHDQSENTTLPLDFENNGLIWFPPPPEDEGDDVEDNFFGYDDEDDEVGSSGMFFSSGSFASETSSVKEKSNDGQKEPLRAVVHGHFRALVLQLLKGEGICTETEDVEAGWLEIVASLAWQAANFVKPDTSRGGSMDPGDYVKVKCVLSGNPCESTLVKGVVCTKNVKHKRMVSQYRNARLLLLGGSLEYQRVPNQLASIDTLLQQEIDHLKMTVAKIESHRPNVLLVERSVSSYAQEYLLAKEISLVLNVKKPLLQRISRCTGANIVPSVDNVASARLGHCEVFRLEKVSEDSSSSGQPSKKSTKTLMFFEGCPRRLGCTVLLRGKSLEELKKVKHVMQYAIFAAYHLSLETSFLADEGASLPKVPLEPSISVLEKLQNIDSAISSIGNPTASSTCREIEAEFQRVGSFNKVVPLPSLDIPSETEGILGCNSECEEWESTIVRFKFPEAGLVSGENFNSPSKSEWESFQKTFSHEEAAPHGSHNILVEEENVSNIDMSGNYFSSTDNNQSILVSFSSRCVLKGTVCERSQLLRIKFYGSFDKPLGRFLRDDLFDQRSSCRSCNEPVEAHMRCYTHQQGSLTISVRRLPSLKLPGERDGKIWMWHRCLKCALIDGVPPATRRVVMSDDAWGLSFGKFLELSFSNHATANRVANCGHSLQRDCLRYYGFGSMVAFFRYSPIDILSVFLPPSMLEFCDQSQLEWLQKEVSEALNKMESMYAEIFDALESIEKKILFSGFDSSRADELHNHFMELKELLKKERNEYEGLLQSMAPENAQSDRVDPDILELNRLRRCLLIDSYMWDRRLSMLDSFLKTINTSSEVDHNLLENLASHKFKDLSGESVTKDRSPSIEPENTGQRHLSMVENTEDMTSLHPDANYDTNLADPISHEPVKADYLGEEEGCCLQDSLDTKSLDNSASPVSNLSDKIDLAWTGSDLSTAVVTGMVEPVMQLDNIHHRRVMAPVRVRSFDSALRFQEKLHKGLPPASLHVSHVKSFHASGDFGSLVRDPISNRLRTYTRTSPMATQKLNFIFGYTPLYISSTSCMVSDGARLLLPLTGSNNIVVAVYDHEPTSIISYALSSREYMTSVSDKLEGHEGLGENENIKDDEIGNLLGYQAAVTTLSAWQSFSSLDLDETQYRSYGSSDASSLRGRTLFSDSKQFQHVRVTFEDESSLPMGKVKFSVTCYFAKQFDALRKKCCPSEVDFVRSLSRCKRWSAQGGKSNVYFAKTLDERFIIKQVTKTELESFEEFAPDYFKYLMDSLSSGSPTCLAKVLGIYQVTVKHLRGSKEMKMDLMVMENLFFRRNISEVYDLKGSSRSRYNSDTTGSNKILLDLNLLETLLTNPMFLGSKAKRKLERAIWNDTSFLAAIDVMDYSLLVGVDQERKELVMGIIDFMRQYTWDKHLETWVKAVGILGGPKNASPTVISPKQYKKRFRKAMSTYFLTVPDQWSS